MWLMTRCKVGLSSLCPHSSNELVVGVFEGPYQSPAPPPSRLLVESPLLLAAAEAKVDVNGEGMLLVELECGLHKLWERHKYSSWERTGRGGFGGP